MNRKTITRDEQELVAAFVSGFMDRFGELAPLMAASPEKGAHLLNLGIVSFVYTVAHHLDEIHDKLKKETGYTGLNMHGEKFNTHLEMFQYLLRHGNKSKVDRERSF